MNTCTQTVRIVALVAISVVFGMSRWSAGDDGHKQGHGRHDDAKHPQPHTDAKHETHSGDPYTLNIDLVSGKALGDNPVIVRHEGREFRFANQENADRFKAAPAKYIPGIDRKMIEVQLAHYPLDTCVVSRQKLGSMGDPVDYIHYNRLIRFCCAKCISAFVSGSDKLLVTLDQAAINKQKPHYPTDRCVVSGEKLTDHGDPIDRVIANRLFRFCCQGCVGEFMENPPAHIELLNRSKSGPGASHGPGSSREGSSPRDNHGSHGHGH